MLQPACAMVNRTVRTEVRISWFLSLNVKNGWVCIRPGVLLLSGRHHSDVNSRMISIRVCKRIGLFK